MRYTYPSPGRPSVITGQKSLFDRSGPVTRDGICGRVGPSGSTSEGDVVLPTTDDILSPSTLGGSVVHKTGVIMDDTL